MSDQKPNFTADLLQALAAGIDKVLPGNDRGRTAANLENRSSPT